MSRLTGARYVLADKGYDADALRQQLRDSGIVPVIPGRINRKRKVSYDKGRYKESRRIENAFCLTKDLRRVAKQHDKLAESFLSAVALATLLVYWL
jgi:transposase